MITIEIKEMSINFNNALLFLPPQRSKRPSMRKYVRQIVHPGGNQDPVVGK